MERVLAIEITSAEIKGNRIKKVLEELEVTQEEAARRVGISYRHFNRIVLGYCEPSLLIALRFQIILGRPLDQLWQVRLGTRKRSAVAA